MQKTDRQNLIKRGVFYALLVLICMNLSSCSTTSGEDVVYDPFEDVNRATLAINEAVDQAVLEPVARGYRAVTPRGVRLGVRSFLRNLRSPLTIGNQLLQGDFEGASNAVARTVINTFAGFGGIVDVAEEGGIEHEEEDFGQTLGKWGIGDGPYLVLPILGPSTMRDGVGIAVDAYLDPLRMYLFNTDQEEWHYGRIAASTIDKREELLDVIDDLRKNSLDYYAAVRSAYIQRRKALINDEDPDSTDLAEIPDYDDL